MSDFKKFNDESSSSSSSSESSKKKGDKTTSKFVNSSQPVYGEEEFRNDKLDANFRRSPIKTWLKMLFPHFRLLSISVILAVIILLLYIIQLLLYINNSWSCLTYTLGSNYTAAIKRWHIYRLVAPAFFHNDLAHCLWNMFVLICVGCNAEYYLGTIGYAGLLGASIFLGNLFTAAFRHYICSQAMGTSTAVMGILAFEFVWMIFNFFRMGWSKWFYAMYFFSIFGTTVLAIFVPGYVIEFWGHLGGFVAGFCVT